MRVCITPLIDLVESTWNTKNFMMTAPNRSQTLGRILGAVSGAMAIRVVVMGAEMAADQRKVWSKEWMETFAELCVQCNVQSLSRDPFDEIQAEEVAYQECEEFFECVTRSLTPY